MYKENAHKPYLCTKVVVNIYSSYVCTYILLDVSIRSALSISITLLNLLELVYISQFFYKMPGI